MNRVEGSQEYTARGTYDNIIVCMTGVYECRQFLECCKYLSSNDSLITIVGVLQCDKNCLQPYTCTCIVL